MAKNLSLFKFSGSIGGITFFESGGKSYVRLTRGPEKTAIMNNAAFKRTRENMSEFGGAAKAGKAFRMAFSDIVIKMADRHLSARLLGLMKRIINLGAGVRGKRAIDVVANSIWLKGLEFNEHSSLGSVFFPHYLDPAFNANRDTASLHIPEFNTDTCIVPPDGSTHFRVLLACGTLSNYLFDDEMNQYVPADPDHDSLHVLVESPAIPLGGMSGGDIDLTADLAIGAALPANVVSMAAVGIVFFQEINSVLYELASNNAMRIDAIG
jgi:hypothetical protein